MRTFFGICIIILVSACSMTSVKSTKINGVSFVSSRTPIDTSHVNPVISIHANYASIMPFAFVRNIEHPEVIHNRGRQMYGETRGGVKQYIETLHEQGVKIMLKPQLWVG